MIPSVSTSAAALAMARVWTTPVPTIVMAWDSSVTRRVSPNCDELARARTRAARPGSWLTTPATVAGVRSEEHTSELQSLMRISYAVFCLKKKKIYKKTHEKETKLNKTNTHII